MVSYDVPDFIIWIFIIFTFILLVLTAYFVFLFWRNKVSDTLIFLDKDNRWEMVKDRLFGRTKAFHNGKTYSLEEDSALVNRAGKSLYVFSIGRPEPLKLSYNKASWIDSKSLTEFINNQHIQALIRGKQDMKDLLIILGSIAAIITSIIALVLLLMQMGVITPNA